MKMMILEMTSFSQCPTITQRIGKRAGECTG